MFFLLQYHNRQVLVNLHLVFDLEILLTILITSNNVVNFFVCIKFIKFNFFDLTILFNKDTTSSI